MAPDGPGAAAPAASQPYVATIGDIGITESLVVTPSGTGPLAGSQWVLTDFTHTDSKIPTWAIVLAVVFALACLLGLLFLLVKEHTTTGYVEISVRTTDGVYHVTRIPVQDQNQLLYWRNMVAWAQGVAVQV